MKSKIIYLVVPFYNAASQNNIKAFFEKEKAQRYFNKMDDNGYRVELFSIKVK